MTHIDGAFFVCARPGYLEFQVVAKDLFYGRTWSIVPVAIVDILHTQKQTLTTTVEILRALP